MKKYKNKVLNQNIKNFKKRDKKNQKLQGLE
jgi:hypothetical protein